jgi:chromosomal replication initiation ATPase DnaA
MNLWDEILARHRNEGNRHSFYTWFRPTTFLAEDRLCQCPGPNALFKDWLTKHYSGVINEAMTSSKRRTSVHLWPTRKQMAHRFNLARRGRRARDDSASPGLGPRASTSLHVRHIHRRFLESIRPRGVSSGGGSAVALVQPAVHLRPVGLGKTHLMHAVGAHASSSTIAT